MYLYYDGLNFCMKLKRHNENQLIDHYISKKFSLFQISALFVSWNLILDHLGDGPKMTSYHDVTNVV